LFIISTVALPSIVALSSKTGSSKASDTGESATAKDAAKQSRQKGPGILKINGGPTEAFVTVENVACGLKLEVPRAVGFVALRE